MKPWQIIFVFLPISMFTGIIASYLNVGVALHDMILILATIIITMIVF